MIQFELVALATHAILLLLSFSPTFPDILCDSAALLLLQVLPLITDELLVIPLLLRRLNVWIVVRLNFT